MNSIIAKILLRQVLFLCMVRQVTASSVSPLLFSRRSLEQQSIHQGPISIAEKSLDALVVKGIAHIIKNGERFSARAGNGVQAYGVSYTLLNPTDRLLNLRQPTSIKYFCKELLAYFKGSLQADEGLSQASTVWKKLADRNGEILSNYGYYVFHQKNPETNQTQYEWVMENLKRNLDSRRAFININQLCHKKETKDFPCTIGLQFFKQKNELCCTVSSRSTDVYTGLPYDMGFFSFLLELIYRDLKEQLPSNIAAQLKLGYVTMQTNFTQIYDKTKEKNLQLLQSSADPEVMSDQRHIPFAPFSPVNKGLSAPPPFCSSCQTEPTKINQRQEIPFSPPLLWDKSPYNPPAKQQHSMPIIQDAQATLKDIYQQTAQTNVMKWIYHHAEL